MSSDASSHDGGDRAERDGSYRVVVPARLDPRRAASLRAYAAERIVSRAGTSEGVATYCELLAAHYEECGPPHHVKQLDERGGAGRPATNALRNAWDPHTAALSCAADALRHGPWMLLAEPLSARRSRPEDRFTIYGVSALFDGGRAVPTAQRRAFGDIDARTDAAIVDVIAATTTVARNCGCQAPIVSFDLFLADAVIGRLAGDDHPFAAAVGPGWGHEAIHSLDIGRLSARTPREVFDSERIRSKDGRVLVVRTTASGHTVQLARMQYRERAAGRLFYARVEGPREQLFLLRAPGTERDGVHEQLGRAAELAVAAAALADERPLATLGIEHYYASEREEQRWRRHAALLQALVTFDLTVRD